MQTLSLQSDKKPLIPFLKVLLPVHPSLQKKKIKKIKSTKRALSVATADNWKNSSLIKYSGEVWLEVNIDPANKTNVSTLACKICKRFEDRINSIRNFNEAWVRDGSKRLLLHAAIEHAEGEPHKKAYDLHLKEQGLSISMLRSFKSKFRWHASWFRCHETEGL